MTKAAAKTGVGSMVMVAIEQHFPKSQRIADDGLAYRMLPLGMRVLVSMMRPDPARDWIVREAERSIPGIWGGMMCRKRYIDEKVVASVGQTDVVVNLGAGFDTRAFRLSALANVPIWELDHQENVERKRVRLQKVFGEMPANVSLVPIDFDHENLGAVLATHGYSADSRSFFIWEAVTQYLTEAGVRATFDFLARVASGSRLAFTYVRKDFLDGQAMYSQEATYEKYVVKDRTWLFGMDPEGVPDLLGEYGWRVIEHLGYEDLVERYVKPTGRRLAATPIERMVYAEKRVFPPPGARNGSGTWPARPRGSLSTRPGRS